MRGPSHFVRIKPMAFKYDRLKRFATMKCEFIDFFNYAIILDPSRAVVQTPEFVVLRLGRLCTWLFV